jgi:hypothetical protein
MMLLGLAIVLVRAAAGAAKPAHCSYGETATPEQIA